MSKPEDKIRDSLKKGFAFARKAKDALSGDESAKKELSDAASDALVKGAETLDRAEDFLKVVKDKANKKIDDMRKPK